MRGLENVRAEFSLTALAYNLRCALNILGVAPMTAANDERDATLYVCITCKAGEERLGQALFDALSARIAADGEAGVGLRAVECLSVCKRPCTVALTARGKWTYVVGDLACESHLEDIVTAARLYAASPAGIVPWRERPLSFRKGVISRTPPLAPTSLAQI